MFFYKHKKITIEKCKQSRSGFTAGFAIGFAIGFANGFVGKKSKTCDYCFIKNFAYENSFKRQKKILKWKFL